MEVNELAHQAARAKHNLAVLGSEAKNQALSDIASALMDRRSEIESVNQADIDRSQAENLPAPLITRLRFDRQKILEAVAGIRHLIKLPEPVGTTLRATEMSPGLELYQVSCPIGVIGVIFESRPDALVQISSLCLKSGNAVLLKGGTEASETNQLLTRIIHDAGVNAGTPAGWLGLLTSRTQVRTMLALAEYIDLIIPRGGNAFVQHIMRNTTIPVLGHADGVCHVYIDRTADLEMAFKVTMDSKCQYVSVCNAAETLLVHRDVAARFLPKIRDGLTAKGVEIRGCPGTAAVIRVKNAAPEDWRAEYLDLIISIRVVESLDQAVKHINHYGSGHTDVIVCNDRDRGRRFMDLVDSADVFVNCSSRFSDGFRYGLGAEVGISTNKIHARGPVGLEGLLIHKWKLIGNGHLVSDFTGKDARPFTHKKINTPFPD